MRALIAKQIMLGVCVSLAMSGSFSHANTHQWKTQAELGGTLTTGNSESSSVRGALTVNHQWGQWQNQYDLNALYSENKDDDDGDISRTQTYEANAQSEYQLSDRLYWFGNGNYFRDPATGYQYTITAASGYGYRLYHTETTTLELEFGPGYQYQKLSGEEAALVGDDYQESWIAHSVVDFQHQLSDSAKFQQLFIVDAGEKVLASSETSLTTTIIGQLAMKLAVVVRYDSEPLLENTSTDTETNMTLLYSF